MTDPANTDPATPRKAVTKAQAAKLIGGMVRALHKTRDGKIEPVERPLVADDILALVDHGDRIVVVTIDGQRREAPVPVKA